MAVSSFTVCNIYPDIQPLLSSEVFFTKYFVLVV